MRAIAAALTLGLALTTTAVPAHTPRPPDHSIHDRRPPADRARPVDRTDVRTGQPILTSPTP